MIFDAAMDAAPDAAPDAAMDPAPDAAPDAAMDPAPDAATDAPASGATDAAEVPSCRICFEPDGELIAPCGCQGTQRFVHVACLRRWQHSVVLAAPNNPHAADADAERRHLRCGVCLRDFSVAPPSRLELMSAIVGPAVASAL